MQYTEHFNKKLLDVNSPFIFSEAENKVNFDTSSASCHWYVHRLFGFENDQYTVLCIWLAATVRHFCANL